jgi:hypothetical protein
MAEVQRLTAINTQLEAALSEAQTKECEACMAYRGWPEDRDTLIARSIVLQRQQWMTGGYLEPYGPVVRELEYLKRDVPERIEFLLTQIHDAFKHTV